MGLHKDNRSLSRVSGADPATIWPRSVFALALIWFWAMESDLGQIQPRFVPVSEAWLRKANTHSLARYSRGSCFSYLPCISLRTKKEDENILD